MAVREEGAPNTMSEERESLFDAASFRDLRKIEEKASEVLRQCEYLRRNGPSDELRFGMLREDFIK